MRCFVRIEGQPPFLLLLEPGCTLEHYKDVVEDHYRSFFDERTKPPDLILIRCLIFSDSDRLMDFRQKKQTTGAVGGPSTAISAALVPAGPTSVPSNNAGASDELLLAEYEDELLHLDSACVFAQNPSTAKCQTDNVISRITMPRLMRVLCDPYCDAYTHAVFWTLFTTFTVPSFVLEHMMRRFDEPSSVLAKLDAAAVANGSPAGAIASPLRRAMYEHVIDKMRERIVSMIEQWISRTPWHFDDQMVQQATSWAHEKVVARVASPSLLEALRGMDRRPLWHRQRPSLCSVAPPAGAPPRGLTHFDSVSARHLADQLHYASSVVYSAILPEELLNGHHDVEGEQHLCPNVTSYLAFHRRVQNWVSHTILSVTSLDERIAVVRKFVFAADHLKRLRSFDALLAVYGGLTHRAVSRLQRTFAGVRLHCGAVLDDLGHLFAVQGGLSTFKATIEEARRQQEPHIPCILVYLRDILQIERQQMPHVQSHILFARAVRLYNLLEFLLSQQNVKWGVLPDDVVLSVFETWRVVPTDTLDILSLQMEPVDATV